jgi:hypothetical protein
MFGSSWEEGFSQAAFWVTNFYSLEVHCMQTLKYAMEFHLLSKHP